MNRTNRSTTVKTFRLRPSLVEDMEKVIYLSRKGAEKKFPNMTNFLTVALSEQVRRERRLLEDAGIVWNHITNFKPKE